jgi:hypothetical protein
LKDQYLAIGIDDERGGRKLSPGKSGKGSETASSMRLLLLENEFGRDNHYRHEHEKPRIDIRRRGLDGSKSGKGSKVSSGKSGKGSETASSMRLLLLANEFGRDNHYRHEHEKPHMNIRRRGLDGGFKAKASKAGGSIRLLLSEFGM